MLEVFIIGSGVVGLIWAYYNYSKLKAMDVEGEGSDEEMKQSLMPKSPGVVEIGAIIAEGASEFIWSEYKISALLIIGMAIIVYFCVDQAQTWLTTISFLLGAITSMFCGAFGMKIATFSNYRTTLCAKTSLGEAFRTAYRAGCIMGFTLVSVSMMVLMVLILIYKSVLDI